MRKQFIFRNDDDGRYVVVRKRVTAGDILGHFEGDIFIVDQSSVWLWEWEKNDPNCYARKCQKKAILPVKHGS